MNGQNFTGESDETEISPKREIGNSPVKSMWVSSLHQVNCETKYTIPIYSGNYWWNLAGLSNSHPNLGNIFKISP